MKNDSQQYRAHIKAQKKKKKRLKIILFIIVPLILIIGAVGIYVSSLLNHAADAVDGAYEDDGRENGSNLRENEVSPTEDNVSILFIGIDESEKRIKNNQTNQLSDALILATLNNKDHSIKMLSIPRDSYVYVPERDKYTKINHAHSYGGPPATIETVEQFLNIPVDYYVRINFNAFMEMVDTLGGITVDVPYEMYEQDSNDKANAIHLMPGEQLLDGEEALALARTRKQDNDIERGKRQQEIIKAIVKKSLSMGSILKYDELIDAVGDNMKTNMTFDEIKSLIAYGKTGNLNIESYSLDGSDSYIGNTYYYQVDEESRSTIENTLKAHLDFIDDSTLNSTNDNTTNEDNTYDTEIN